MEREGKNPARGRVVAVELRYGGNESPTGGIRDDATYCHSTYGGTRYKVTVDDLS